MKAEDTFPLLNRVQPIANNIYHTTDMILPTRRYPTESVISFSVWEQIPRRKGTVYLSCEFTGSLGKLCLLMTAQNSGVMEKSKKHARVIDKKRHLMHIKKPNKLQYLETGGDNLL